MERIETVQKHEVVQKREGKLIYELVKRVFDFISSLIALVILSPLFVFIIIFIKIDSKGESIFGHERIGRDGKKIKVYKFRTMYQNSQEIFENFSKEQKEEYYKNFKLDNDPRITKIGDILRKTSLDELPQLVNIIKGNMSVVGPRPIVEKEVEKFGDNSQKLFTVKPGLTGYWQANGRSSTTYEERVEMEMYYIDNRSFYLDLKIIFKTIFSVIKREGAV